MAHQPEMMELMKEQMEMMKRQMEENTRLQEENATLRERHTHVATNAKKPNRPIVEASISDNDWALFLDSWKRYKRLVRVTGAEEVAMELRECCSTDVNKLLFQFVGPDALDRATEEELLSHVKAVAVKGVHKEVHRLKFTSLRQQDGEPVTQYVGRLKAQAALCGFVVKCTEANCGTADRPTYVSYAQDIISHQLLAGLRNQEFQSRLLSEAATLTTLNEKVARLQVLESTEECSNVLHPSMPESKVAALKRSTYKKERHRDEKESSKVIICQGCGRRSHTEGRSCPAQNRKCLSCGGMGHFKVVCPRKKTNLTKASYAADESVSDGEGEEGTAAALISASTFF